jgi:hypothetical protein
MYRCPSSPPSSAPSSPPSRNSPTPTPFLPEWVEFERAALGDAFVAGEPVWSQHVRDPEQPRANVWRIVERLEALAATLQARLREGVEARPADLVLYEDASCTCSISVTTAISSQPLSDPPPPKATPARWRFYNNFLADWRRFFHIDGVRFPTGHDPRHTFACFRQIQCAFEQVFRDIIGSSMPAARLRASIWQSIFTHDIRRYRRTLYARMGEFATLITGPSGTGKELVARAIAQSRYVPFDDRRLSFADDCGFFPINISALSPTLVESELFGHRRGAFTGAIADRKGWLETCPELGSVFLDELGDLDPAIQVKLLRVIETRTFHPVGDTASRQFRGKLITATNRDLAALIAKGRFREGPVLPPLFRPGGHARARRATGRFARRSAGAGLLYVAPRGGRRGRNARARSARLAGRQPAAGLRLARQLPGARAVRERTC